VGSFPAHLRLRIPTVSGLPTAKVDRPIPLDDRFERNHATSPRRTIDFLSRSNRFGPERPRDARNILLTHEGWRHGHDNLPASVDREAANVRLTAKRVEGCQIPARPWCAVSGCQ
jgi:hypothetical protein